jgi:hypothetical protein
MKRTSDMRIISVFFLLFCSLGSWAQFAQVPILRNYRPNKSTNATARVQDTTKLLSAMQLPFWDDFSYTNGQSHPNDSLWQYGHSVWVNNGMAINAPTVKVGTFDGIDSTGLPYNINLPLAKGIADRLTSRPLRMDLVAPANRDSVFIFFYYQWEGNGEPPDPGDDLSLWFKSDSSVWKQVWSVGVDSTSDNTKFIPVKLLITDSVYFHQSFQFRFQNFGRLSGPFDTWNLDYVYVSNGVQQYAPQFKDFPDRALASTLSSFLKQYQSIPVKHFLAKSDSMMTYPTITVTNQRRDQSVQANYPQPVNLDAGLTVTTRVDTTVSVSTVPFYSVPAKEVFYGQPTVFSLDTTHSFAGLDPKTDSIALKFGIKISTKDNVKKIGTSQGDFDTLVYKGLDFRFNDSTTVDFLLKNYYAYDDGGAEYAVTLTQPGASLAYEFDVAYSQPDTVVAVDVYFPHVGDESDQVVLLKVWNSLSMPPADSLALTVQRTVNDTFIHVPLDHGILVKGKFFVGWKQNSTATIGVGYDKDSDSGTKIFYNTAGTWVQNTILHGNLMIRPAFGNMPLSTVTAVEEKLVSLYPNPNRGVFYLPPSSQGIQLIDITGRRVSFTEETFIDKKQITIGNPSTGVYIARYFNGTQWRTEKIMVLQ